MIYMIKHMKKQTFIQHLTNLRNFIKYFILFGIFLFFIMYIFLKHKIIDLFIRIINSMGVEYINYVSIYEGFFLIFKLIFYLWGLLLIIIFITAFFIFIEEKIFAFYFLFSLPFLLYVNFKYLIPLSWKNLYVIKPVIGNYFITLQEILNFIININLCSCIVFYLPLLIILLYLYKIISEDIFKKIEKYWYFLSILISGIIAPADMVSHLVMTIFMILIFKILLVVLLIFKKWKSKIL
jgi:sec-independent protein translocase protein TatC